MLFLEKISFHMYRVGIDNAILFILCIMNDVISIFKRQHTRKKHTIRGYHRIRIHRSWFFFR